MWVFFLYALLLQLSFLASISLSASLCNPNDSQSLLSFSLQLSPLLNWSSSSSSSNSDCCRWEGVTCDSVSGRVIELSLTDKTLNGSLPPSILKLSHLSRLNLTKNKISGNLPPSFFDSLTALKDLDLSFNSISGELPPLPPNNSLLSLNIASNKFSGNISESFFRLGRSLINFNASDNGFSGQIPSPICDGSSNPNSSVYISSLDFSNNNFSGQIPKGLGGCSKLETFRAGFNSLTGELPEDMYGATSLQEISLFVNQLTGPIGNGITKLTNIRILALYSNNFTGPIPVDIGKLSRLELLLLHINNLTGSLPTSLKGCISIRKLYLRVNKLSGDITDFDFSPLKQLTTLDLGNNNFTGNFPRSLYSCRALTAVRLATNSLRGQILPDIANLQSLSFISISNNSFENITGALSILTGCKNLTTVILSKNFAYETMPGEVLANSNGFQNLQVLALGGCKLQGSVPRWLQGLNSLEVLDLSQNLLSGSIPGWLGNMPNLFYIDLSTNQLSGGFPLEFTALPKLSSGQPPNLVNQTFLELPVFVMPNNVTNQQYNQLSNLPPAIYLYNNSLNGPIPTGIRQLKSLHILQLSRNNFSGTIPDEISGLTNLEILDLSNNEFTGAIPESLEKLHFLSSFNVAYNNLQGKIPMGGQFDTFLNSSYTGNPELCGLPLTKKCSNYTNSSGQAGHKYVFGKKVILAIVLGVIFATFLVILLVLWVLLKCKIIPRRDSDKIELGSAAINSNLGSGSYLVRDKSLVIIFHDNLNDMKDLTISEILEATENFNQANIIGCGAFGLVYKAILTNGTKVAVKKLSGDMGLMEKEFKAEVEVLSNARHENLVTLQGYCIHEGSRLLIYSYMENGSLDFWLHERSDGPAMLTWPMRLRITKGASRGIAYMHQICVPHIVHRDIKSSNILLDDKFEAHLADFGLSRLILPYQTHVTTELVGTLGYIPPEYAHSWVATLRGDMYSFGVVMLELLTGKRSVEISKPKESRELVRWVQEMRKEGKQNEIFDPLLLGNGFEGQMLQVLDLACMCVNSNQFKRPTIQDVIDWLNNVD
ncbi:hypothetical protein SAY86_020600 [Trapa natans]|uniref:non-specific serine/threonine protein kinase n=1 Tax=Trapa natans TaxID=22666 RepID=A0AAN7LMY3_TRANT|nr:hypothetical protein SAY86_020600 [Trapa natans]